VIRRSKKIIVVGYNSYKSNPLDLSQARKAENLGSLPWPFAAVACVLFVFIALAVSAQQYSPDVLAACEWRDVGRCAPAHVYAVAGNSAQRTFYTGSVEAAYGDRKTRATWFFMAMDATTGFRLVDWRHTVAPSDPNIV